MTKTDNTHDAAIIELSPNEVEAVGGGMLGFVIGAIVIGIAFSKSPSQNQNHRGARPDGIGWRA